MSIPVGTATTNVTTRTPQITRVSLLGIMSFALFCADLIHDEKHFVEKKVNFLRTRRNFFAEKDETNAIE